MVLPAYLTTRAGPLLLANAGPAAPVLFTNSLPLASMINLFSASGHHGRVRPFALLLALLLLLAGRAARAQAPAWAGAAATSTPALVSLNGTSVTRGTAVDPTSGAVYLTGTFTGKVAFGSTVLTSAGGNDMFVAKWDPATGAFTSAVSGGGTGDDQGLGICLFRAPNRTYLYTTGYFTSGANAVIAGTALAGAGGTDIFVTSYQDAGSGLVAATNGALSGGGTGADQGLAITMPNGLLRPYVTGFFTSGTGAVIAGNSLAGAGGTDMFMAAYSETGGAGLGITNGGSINGAVSGGGSSDDRGTAIAGITKSIYDPVQVYVTGAFASTNATFAGTTGLSSPFGNTDVFVARYVDSRNNFPANGGAVRGGGNGNDQGLGIAAGLSATNTFNIFVTGSFSASSTATIAGSTLTSRGGTDVFVAKFTDTGTSGLTTTNGGAVGGGGAGDDQGLAVAVSGRNSGTLVYVTGSFTQVSSGNAVVIAGSTLTGKGNTDAFVARYPDPGTAFDGTGGSAVGAGGFQADAGQALGLNAAGTALYLGAGVGTTGALLGTNVDNATPPNSAVVGQLDATTLAWQANDSPAGTGASVIQAQATDYAGNVYVTGYFTGTVFFGSTRLVSAGSYDVFVAKWNPNTATYTSAVREGGTGTDQGTGLAVNSSAGTTSVYVTGSFGSASGARIAGTALAGAGGTDLFVARYTDTGSGLVAGEALSNGGSQNERANALAVGTAGGVVSVYITGFFASNPCVIAGSSLLVTGSSGTDMFVAKYTDAGSGLTAAGAVRGGGSGDEAGTGVATRTTGTKATVYVTGNFTPGSGTSFAGTGSLNNGPAGTNDVFVARYTDTGTGLTGGGAVVGSGSASDDYAAGIAVGTAGGVVSVYVTGYYASTTFAIAGSNLANSGSFDLFVAKYTDAGTSLTAAGALRSTGTNDELGLGIAVASNGTTTTTANVYVTGTFSGSAATIAGTALATGGGNDLFLAKYTDPGTGLTATNGGAIRGGGANTDFGNALAIAGQNVYAGGYFTSTATFGSTTLGSPTTGNSAVLGRVLDTSLVPLPAVQGLSTTAELPGQPVVITGSGFTSASTVTFGGVAAASVTYTSATSLTAVVPLGAPVGSVAVVVTTDGNSYSSPQGFEVLQVYRNANPSGCLATASLVLNGTGGTGAWRYLRLAGAGGAVVAAIEDTYNLGTVTAG
ncbi:MAG: hypothetical protein JWP58_2786, partial [Hymenobacter sp.]|nr:hypothetical protein [Hymenobacter sp.]